VRARLAKKSRLDAVVSKASSEWAARSARHVADELAKLPANDLNAFRNGKALRDLLREEFPARAGTVAQAERAWGERSAAGLVANIEAVPAGDCDGLVRFREQVKQLTDELPNTQARLLQAEQVWSERTGEHLEKRLSKLPLDDWAGYERIGGEHRRVRELLPALAPRLDAAEWAWAERVVDDAVSKSRPLLEKEPLKVSETLRGLAVKFDRSGFLALRPDQPPQAPDGAPAMTRSKLIKVRLEAARAALTAAQRQARQLIREDRYQAALAVAEQTDEKLGNEARALGLGDELTRFRETCAFVARLAKEAGKEDPK
jgi:hypothetical protein